MGVNEKVFVQMGTSHLSRVVSLYLEHEATNVLLSRYETIYFKPNEDYKTVELMVRGSAHSDFLKIICAEMFIFLYIYR